MTCTGNCNQGRNCTCLTGAAYLADALDYKMADDDAAPYIDGWYWGVVCGFCGTLAFVAVCVAAGYAFGLIF